MEDINEELKKREHLQLILNEKEFEDEPKLNFEQKQSILVEKDLPELSIKSKEIGRRKANEEIVRKVIEDEITKEKYLEEVKEKQDEKICQEFEIKCNEKEKKFLFTEFGKFTDFLAIAQVFIKYQPIYYDKNRIWWIWNNIELKWERIDETDLLIAIDEHTKNPSVDGKTKSEILEALKRVGRKNKPKPSKDTWVQFQDVIIDIITGERIKVSPEYFVTNPIPWRIGKNEDTPFMDKIFKEWVFKQGIQEDSYVKTLYQIMAYCLVPSMPIHRIFCLIGDGLNGKGTFLRVVEKLVGEGNKCASEVEMLSSNRFESSKLFKKLVCFVGEIDRGIFKKTKTLKSLSGDDLVRFEIKGKDSFDGHNYAKPLIATNHLPESSDKSKGFYRRWTIIDFPNRFDEKKKIENDIPNEEFENFCFKSLKVLRELFEVGEFENDGTIEQRENKYERHSSFIGEFINIYCERDINSYITFSDFCDKYNEYLINEGLFRKSKIEIGRILTLKGFEKKRRNVTSDLRGTSEIIINGIRFKGELL